MELKQTSTIDKFICMSLNYLYIMNLYRGFCLSVRAGDALMIEWIYKEFLPILLVTRKTRYFEIVLGMIDEHYGFISSKLLQFVRLNRTVPLYNGMDKFGNPMANWALDAVIEYIQNFYHEINFDNTISGWLRHSSNVILMKKCSRIAKAEYGRI